MRSYSNCYENSSNLLKMMMIIMALKMQECSYFNFIDWEICSSLLVDKLNFNCCNYFTLLAAKIVKGAKLKRQQKEKIWC